MSLNGDRYGYYPGTVNRLLYTQPLLLSKVNYSYNDKTNEYILVDKTENKYSIENLSNIKGFVAIPIKMISGGGRGAHYNAAGGHVPSFGGQALNSNLLHKYQAYLVEPLIDALDMFQDKSQPPIMHGEYEIKAGNISLVSSKHTLYKEDNKLEKLETYMYDSIRPYNIIEKKMKNSKNEEYIEKYYYTNNVIPDEEVLTLSQRSAIQDMDEKNYKTTLIQKNIQKDNKKLYSNLIGYKNLYGNLFVPETSYSQIGINAFVNSIQYHKYDQYGNPIYITKDDITKIVYLWSYSGQYPIAEIKNATYIDVNTALATVGLTSIDALSANTNPDKTKLDKLRTLPILANAMITTYKYQPLVGMLESTDPSGLTTYHEYDTFNRLKRTYIKDQSGKEQTLQQYDYHYQNQ